MSQNNQNNPEFKNALIEEIKNLLNDLREEQKGRISSLGDVYPPNKSAFLFGVNKIHDKLCDFPNIDETMILRDIGSLYNNELAEVNQYEYEYKKKTKRPSPSSIKKMQGLMGEVINRIDRIIFPFIEKL